MSVRSQATRNVSWIARSSASKASLVPYMRVVIAVKSFLILDKGSRYLTAEAESLFALFV